MKPILCIYHANCLDGFTAASFAHLIYPSADFIAAHYGDAPPDCTDRDVLILDFSYKRDVMIEIAKQAKSILIIDHHKTAEQDLIDLPDNVITVFDMDKSGAMLAWQYFSDEPPPKLVQHVQDRDLWRFELPDTAAINAYLFSLEFDFIAWHEVGSKLEIESEYEKIVMAGEALERKHSKDVQTLIDLGARTSRISTYAVPVLNCPPMFASKAGHILAQGQLFAATYYETKERVIYSLRSEKNGLDVSEIAKDFGGGGHKHAAGFSLPLFAFFDSE